MCDVAHLWKADELWAREGSVVLDEHTRARQCDLLDELSRLGRWDDAERQCKQSFRGDSRAGLRSVFLCSYSPHDVSGRKTRGVSLEPSSGDSDARTCPAGGTFGWTPYTSITEWRRHDIPPVRVRIRRKNLALVWRPRCLCRTRCVYALIQSSALMMVRDTHLGCAEHASLLSVCLSVAMGRYPEGM